MEDWGSWLVERLSSLTVVSAVFSTVSAYLLWAIADCWVLHRGRKGPVHWPILGATVEVLRNYHQLNDWAVFYFLRDGLTFRCNTANTNYIFTADPANVEYILKTNFENYPKGKVFHTNLEIFLGDGIFNVDGENWKQQRKVASFQFASRRLRDVSLVVFRDYAVKVAFIFTTASMTQKPLEIQDYFMRLTLDSSFEIIFGYKINALNSELTDLPFAKAFDITNEVTSKRFMNPFWKLQRALNVGNEAAVTASAKEMNDFIYSVIKVRKSEFTVNTKGLQQENLHTLRKCDLFTRFMLLNEEGREHQFTDKNFRDTLLNFLLAGRDSTALTLSWFVYMITVHPHVDDKIFQELLALEIELQAVNVTGNKSEPETLGGEDDFNQQILRFSELLTFHSLLKLHYLHACIMETLRLYPAVPMVTESLHPEVHVRFLSHTNPSNSLQLNCGFEVLVNYCGDDVLPDGTAVKKGNMVMYAPYAMGRMPSLWGPDATEFKPERWLLDGVVQPESPFKFFAFQAGPRICLGKDSALFQLRTTLALLCRFFKFQLEPNNVIKYYQQTVLALAHGLHVKISKRCDQ